MCDKNDERICLNWQRTIGACQLTFGVCVHFNLVTHIVTYSQIGTWQKKLYDALINDYRKSKAKLSILYFQNTGVYYGRAKISSFNLFVSLFIQQERGGQGKGVEGGDSYFTPIRVSLYLENMKICFNIQTIICTFGCFTMLCMCGSECTPAYG